MVWLPDCEKIWRCVYSFWQNPRTWRTDGQTDRQTDTHTHTHTDTAWRLTATLHYSSQLQTWFSIRFAARFSTSSCGFATHFRLAFDFVVENVVSVRWFVRVLDKWNVEKPVLSKFAAGFRHAFDLLRSDFRPGLQLARIMECGLKARACIASRSKKTAFEALYCWSYREALKHRAASPRQCLSATAELLVYPVTITFENSIVRIAK